jgi:hypothetical protein
MQLTRQAFFLFALNLFDGIFTIYWIHNGFATEGNELMASLLDFGYTPFLAVKTTVGALTALTLWRWGNLRLAKYGLNLLLGIYVGLMGVHLITGLSGFGFISEASISRFTHWADVIIAFVV